MENTKELLTILEFYVNANKIKTTIVDEVNHYSVADNLFGSMILATLFNSEFKESNNLGKIYRMLILDEFNRLNYDYDISHLKLGEQFKEEISEFRSMSTKDARLAFKYKSLDFSLTELIKTKEGKITTSQLIEEARQIILSYDIYEDLKCDEIFKFYYLNHRLKNKLRSGWDNNHWNIKSDRIERVSEHVVGTMVLAIIFYSEFGYNIDIDKVLKNLVIHETGETLIGDITPFDGMTEEEKKELEQRAMKDAFGNLSGKNTFLKILYDFDDHLTNEAIFAFLCDKMDADLQSKLYQDLGLHHPLSEQENNLAMKSSKVKIMLENGASTPFDIWFEWDKLLYKFDNYNEFLELLYSAKDNNLLEINKSNKVKMLRG